MIVCSLIFLAILLFCPSVALAGSKYGATLWLTELIPTLLPFFIGIRLFQESLPQIAARRGSLLLGLLCGYPTGATLVVYQYQHGLLSKPKAYFYLGFVNNPSPMFILSFCGTYVLQLTYLESLLLFALIILTSLSGSLIFSYLYKKIVPRSCLPLDSAPITSCRQTNTLSQCMDDCILQSFVLITKIGGYVIVFSILGQMLGQFISLNSSSGILSLGALEVTSGISYLKQAPLPHTTKEILTAMLLCFGGLSAVAQTNSILTQSGLSIIPYVLNKLFNSLFVGGIVVLLFRIL